MKNIVENIFYIQNFIRKHKTKVCFILISFVITIDILFLLLCDFLKIPSHPFLKHLPIVIPIFLLLVMIIYCKSVLAIFDSFMLVYFLWIVLITVFPFTYLGSLYPGIVAIVVVGTYVLVRIYIHAKAELLPKKLGEAHISKKIGVIGLRYGIYMGLGCFCVVFLSLSGLDAWGVVGIIFSQPWFCGAVTFITLLSIIGTHWGRATMNSYKFGILLLIIALILFTIDIFVIWLLSVLQSIGFVLYYLFLGMGMILSMVGVTMCLDKKTKKMIGSITIIMLPAPVLFSCLPITTTFYRASYIVWMVTYCIIGISVLISGILVYHAARNQYENKYIEVKNE
ncbi:MAG: hypothetical protein CO114_05865 [Euryarchaeota archaeon CG_4_9_14_3_um_filter_38_12]|nr:MAG: hypothetical protein CO114_05865 [Euryarchaeota archaeon CG_4_9_14_3_um_filter_38_12]